MMKRQRAFKPLTLKLSSIADAAARQAIETLFDRFNVERARANEPARKAALADAQIQFAGGTATIPSPPFRKVA